MRAVAEDGPIPVDVRAMMRAELSAVERALGSPSYPGIHARRLAWQEGGEATYLIAWHGDEPLGHLLVRWGGAQREDVPSALRERPYLEAAAVRPEYQSRGVGTQIFEAAHALAQERGFAAIGLAVGIENVRARALYDRLGYVESGIAPFALTWSYTDAEGRPGIEGEDCIYMMRRLAPYPPAHLTCPQS
jgi:ribosomal protein S18 acetylase RimI-like enzyme